MRPRTRCPSRVRNWSAPTPPTSTTTNTHRNRSTPSTLLPRNSPKPRRPECQRSRWSRISPARSTTVTWSATVSTTRMQAERPSRNPGPHHTTAGGPCPGPPAASPPATPIAHLKPAHRHRRRRRDKIMKVLLAPDKFKGSLTAAEVVDHLGKGLSDRGIKYDGLP